MCQFVNQDSLEFVLVQQPLNALGQLYMRTQKPIYCRSLPTLREPYRDATDKKTPYWLGNVLTSRGLRIATLSPYPQTQARKHQACAEQPNGAEYCGRCIARHDNPDDANNADRCGPPEMRCPELVDNCA